MSGETRTTKLLRATAFQRWKCKETNPLRISASSRVGKISISCLSQEITILAFHVRMWRKLSSDDPDKGKQ